MRQVLIASKDLVQNPKNASSDQGPHCLPFIQDFFFFFFFFFTGGRAYKREWVVVARVTHRFKRYK